MFRYNFVPLERRTERSISPSPIPRNLNLIDEIAGLLRSTKLRVKVATLSQISDLLKKTEQSQRVLEEVTEGFALDVVGDEDNPDENALDRQADRDDSDIAPVIKLVDTTIFNALERRASDIHIETARPGSGHQVPHRRRAALRHAADRQGLALHHHFAHQGHERTRYRRAPRARRTAASACATRTA